MAVVKANYVKRGTGEKGRAKATIRYITHRRDRDNHTVTRDLFGYDGKLSKQQAYKMIDEAPRSTIFYRFVLSPDPKREDRYKDLGLSESTIDTMLALEERLGKQVQFVATLHDDHSPHCHVHALALVQRKLTRDDFRFLRDAATEQTLSQRRIRDRIRDHHLRLRRTRKIHHNINGNTSSGSTSAPSIKATPAAFATTPKPYQSRASAIAVPLVAYIFVAPETESCPLLGEGRPAWNLASPHETRALYPKYSFKFSRQLLFQDSFTPPGPLCQNSRTNKPGEPYL